MKILIVCFSTLGLAIMAIGAYLFNLVKKFNDDDLL